MFYMQICNLFTKLIEAHLFYGFLVFKHQKLKVRAKYSYKGVGAECMLMKNVKLQGFYLSSVSPPLGLVQI
jgi:hypothetical protein